MKTSKEKTILDILEVLAWLGKTHFVTCEFCQLCDIGNSRRYYEEKLKSTKHDFGQLECIGVSKTHSCGVTFVN